MISDLIVLASVAFASSSSWPGRFALACVPGSSSPSTEFQEALGGYDSARRDAGGAPGETIRVTDQEPRTERGGLAGIVIACAIVGAIVVGVTHEVRAGAVAGAGDERCRPIATEDYGRRLIAQTAECIGPDQADPSKRYTNARLSCGSCHLATGTETGHAHADADRRSTTRASRAARARRPTSRIASTSACSGA